MTKKYITILPKQAARIALETAKAGCAVGVTQSGSTLTVNNGKEIFVINAGGHDIPPPNEELTQQC